MGLAVGVAFPLRGRAERVPARRRAAEAEAPRRPGRDSAPEHVVHSRRARRGTEEVDLTEKEFRLLEFLMQNQGAALSRQVLLKNVWERDFETNTNVVGVYVNYLRGKVDRDPARRLIHTVVGIGYMMQAK